MKSILYAGAALMTCAAIYGFVDFKKTNASREFKSMYEEKETLQPQEAREKDKTSPTVDLTRKEETKRVEPVKNVKSREVVTRQEPAKPRSVKKEVDKEISPEFFSRASLKDEPEKKTNEKMKMTPAKESKTDQ